MERVEKIGEGSYGIVYSGKLKETFDSKDATVEEEKMYAVKRNFKEKTASWIGNVHEADILARLRGHPFIVEIHRFSYGDPFGTTKPMTPNLASDRKMKEDKIHFVLEHATHSGDTYLCEDKYFSFYNFFFVKVPFINKTKFDGS